MTNIETQIRTLVDKTIDQQVTWTPRGIDSWSAQSAWVRFDCCKLHHFATPPKIHLDFWSAAESEPERLEACLTLPFDHELGNELVAAITQQVDMAPVLSDALDSPYSLE